MSNKIYNLIIRYGKKTWFKVPIIDLIEIGTKQSRSEIRRMIDQGGVKIYFEDATEGKKHDSVYTNILEMLDK